MVLHRPVLVREVLEGLNLRPGDTVLDATVGLGGHAEEILKVIGPTGRLIGLDRDREALKRASDRLSRYEGQMRLIHGEFGELARLLGEFHVEGLDAALFDLGVSSLQLEKAERGFSFAREGPLDMRMDPTQPVTAAELINHSPFETILEWLNSYGQERWAGRIARAIVRNRPFSTTTALAQVVRQAVPPAARQGSPAFGGTSLDKSREGRSAGARGSASAGRSRIDPATRTFQAIRIAVNRELTLLPVGLKQAIERLKIPGRIAVLAYHSLEDRIVKTIFRDQARAGRCEVLTRKPIRPSEEEVLRNPRSRSARLRIAERIG